MTIHNQKAMDVKIAYIGGGSRGWAWGLMSDLAQTEDMSGSVFLYDIDWEAAQHNEVIGNKIKEAEGCKTAWKYKAVPTLQEALCGAEFVVISILPGTFDEMESDVHAPEKYGIYQSVGDTTGPGGIIRALRTIPMFEEIARAIAEYCPEAWVINYTNPMTLCVQTLYRVFPEIKAFGCCHEVFGTQRVFAKALKEMQGIEAEREEIKVNVLGVNHFTWITRAHYKNLDLMPIYKEFAEKHRERGIVKENENWMNRFFKSAERVKFDLFLRYGVAGAAGDRHLAEFCPGYWYLKDPETVERWHFALTPVSWRKKDLQNRLEKSRRLLSGEETFEIKETGEDGVKQMRALLGLCDLNTNVNLPNVGQISNLPMGAVVETNAAFTADSVYPITAGPVPDTIMPLISRVVAEQQLVNRAAAERSLDTAFLAFSADPLVTIPPAQAKELFDTMVANTAQYLQEYLK